MNRPKVHLRRGKTQGIQRLKRWHLPYQKGLPSKSANPTIIGCKAGPYDLRVCRVPAAIPLVRSQYTR